MAQKNGKVVWTYQVRIRFLAPLKGQKSKVPLEDKWIADRQQDQAEKRYKLELEAHQKALVAGTATPADAPIPPLPVYKTAEQMRDEITLQFERDKQGRLFVPARWFKGAIKAAADSTSGQTGLRYPRGKVNADISVYPRRIPLPLPAAQITEESSPISFIEAGKGQDSAIRVAETADVDEVDTTGWEVDLTIKVVGNQIESSQLERILEAAGVKGIGGGHAQEMNGQFEVVQGTFREV